MFVVLFVFLIDILFRRLLSSQEDRTVGFAQILAARIASSLSAFSLVITASKGVPIVHHHGLDLSASVLEAIYTMGVKYVLNMHDEIPQNFFLGSINVYHNIKFLDDVFDFPLKDSLWVDIEEWNVEF